MPKSHFFLHTNQTPPDLGLQIAVIPRQASIPTASSPAMYLAVAVWSDHTSPVLRRLIGSGSLANSALASASMATQYSSTSFFDMFSSVNWTFDRLSSYK